MNDDIRGVSESEEMIHEDRNHTNHINSCFDGTKFCEAKKLCCESEDERGSIRVIDEDRINSSIKIKGKRGAGLYSRVPMKGVFLVPQHAHHNMNQILECMPHESVAHTHLCVGGDDTSVSEKIYMLESIVDINIELQSSERESPAATFERQESHLNSTKINTGARKKRTRRTLYNEEYVVFCTGNKRLKKSHVDSSQTEYMLNCRQEIVARTFCNVESVVSCTPNKKTEDKTSEDHVTFLNQSDQVEKSIKKKENGRNLEMQTLCKRSNDTEARFLFDTAPMGRDRELKELARNVARKVLLDSGFKLEFRQRKEKDYQDPVYRSPEGHTHWSLPKAWRAFKELQAKGLIEDSKMNYGLAKADKNAIILVFSRFGKKMEVALRNKGCLSGRCLEILEAEVTNAELIDILLEDLGVLNKVVNTTKIQKKQHKGKAKKPYAKGINQRRSTSPGDLDNKSKTKISKLKDIIDIGVLPSVDYVHDRGRKLILLNESRTSSKSQAKFVLEQTEKNMMLTSRASNSPNVCNKFVKSGNKQRILKEFLMKKGYSKNGGPKKQEGLSKKITNMRAHSDVRLQAHPSSLGDNGGNERLSCQTRRGTLFSWMIYRNVIVEREKIFCKDPKTSKVLKEGVVTRDGILCKCCKKVHTLESFRNHIGNIMGDSLQHLVFASGKSLLDCQLDAWNAEVHLTKTSNYVGVTAEDPNDDSCTICGDGGDLICCDRCPSTFHASCLLLDNVPEGDWCCPKCQCVACGGREHSVKEELLMVVCKQCKHRYHVSCMNEKCSMVDHTYFCGDSCEKVYVGLHGFNGVAHPLDGGLEWTLLRCSDITSNCNETRVQVEHNSKLAVGLRVIRECFNPMVDPRTNIDMIAQAVYNRWCEFDRLNYADFYTLVLEDNGEVVSVASIRVHGTRLAEMPLICTQRKYRRKGMCKLLVGIIEKMLGSLGVTTLILPAIPETLATWTNAFGFRPLDPAQKEAIIDFSMMMFPGTELLHKHIQSIDCTER